MQYHNITDFSEINEKDWNQLLTASGIESPFLLYGYQRAWWSHMGGGEWRNAALNIITAYENEKLIGIAPLFRVEQESNNEIHFVGSLEISDYLDFIVSPGRANSFIKGVFDKLSADIAEPFKIVLFNIADNSPTIAALRDIHEEGAWNINLEKAYHTPVIELADTWDEYLAGIDKKQRHEIRRKIRRAENSENDSVNWYVADPHENLGEAIAAFAQLMAYDPEKKKFLTDQMRSQMEAVMQWAADQGILQLSFLTVNGENAAAYLCFDHADRIWVYNSGFSPDFQYYSPGWVLLSYLIQDAIGKKRKHFDFMRGDEQYKYRFGARDSFVMKAIIQRKNA